MCAKISNTTSVGKNLKINQVHGRVTLLPSLFFSHALLVTAILIPLPIEHVHVRVLLCTLLGMIYNII